MKRATYLLFLSLLVYCTSKDNSSTNYVEDRSKKISVEFIKKGSFSISDSTTIIGEIEHPAIIDEERDLFIFRDSKLNQIVIADLDGKINARLGKKGRGPKDFQEIGPFGVDKNGNIYAYNVQTASYKIFNTDGEHIKNFSGLLDKGLWVRSSRLFFENSHIYVGIAEANKNPYWESQTIAEFNQSGKIINIFGEYDPSLINTSVFQKHPNLVYDSDEKLFYTTHTSSNFIQVYDLENKKRIHRFGFRTENFRISNDEIKMSDPLEVRYKKHLKESSVGSSFITSNYFVFYFKNFTEKYWDTWDPNVNDHHFYIYDKNNNYAFLGEIKLPFQPLVVDKKEQVYLLEDDNPSRPLIGIYEITIK